MQRLALIIFVILLRFVFLLGCRSANQSSWCHCLCTGWGLCCWFITWDLVPICCWVGQCKQGPSVLSRSSERTHLYCGQVELGSGTASGIQWPLWTDISVWPRSASSAVPRGRPQDIRITICSQVCHSTASALSVCSISVSTVVYDSTQPSGQISGYSFGVYSIIFLSAKLLYHD